MAHQALVQFGCRGGLPGRQGFQGRGQARCGRPDRRRQPRRRRGHLAQPGVARLQGRGIAPLPARVRQEQRLQEQSQVVQDDQLVVLAVGDEVRQAPHGTHFRQGRDPFGQRGRLRRIVADHVDQVGRRLDRLGKLEEGPNRFESRVLQVDRIEVELPAGRRRRCTEGRSDRRDQGRGPRQTRQTPPAAVTRRADPPQRQNRQQGRQNRKGRDQRDDHASAGDQAQLGQPPVVGGQEGEEADRSADGGQQDARSGGLESRGQGRRPLCPLLLAIAQTGVDAEVHAQADEQHGKGDGDHVEAADGHGREGGRPDQPQQQRHDDREDQAAGAQPPHQQQRDEQQRQHPGGRAPQFHRLQLLVVERHVAGQAHLDAVLRRQTERDGLGAQAVDRRRGRLQGPFGQLGPKDQEAPRRRQEVGVAGQQGLPGQGQGQGFGLCLGHRGHAVQQGRQRRGGLLLRQQVRLPDRLLQNQRQAGKVRPIGEQAEQRLCGHQAVGQGVKLVQPQIEEPGLGEDRLAAGLIDVTKKP